MADDPLREYRLVLAKIDAKVAEISGHQADQLACARGCHACCAPGLTVTAVEAAAIAAHIQCQSDQLLIVQALAAEDPWNGMRCSFLGRDGACSIYAVRPVVCRTQGLPIAIDGGQLTACTLNFGDGLQDLPPGDRIDQKTLSTLLYVVNERFCVNERFGGGERRALTPDGILGDG
jgi:hypothetical protein